jgi:hypothetical protein
VPPDLSALVLYRTPMIRKLASGTGTRRNLGTFKTRAAAERHERAVQFFKRR